MNKQLAHDYHNLLVEEKYAHRFSWLGVPIIQEPQDMVALQELIWKVKPTLIIETGIAHGGSLIFSASMLKLLGGERCVIGVDINIRPPTLETLKSHPLQEMIMTIQGDSVSEGVVGFVREIATAHDTIMVLLDSNHTHNHVLAELKAYAPLVSVGSYCVAFDTGIEDLPVHIQSKDRPWGKGNNPKTAVHEFLKTNTGFRIAYEIENRLIITSSPDGWLQRVR